MPLVFDTDKRQMPIMMGGKKKVKNKSKGKMETTKANPSPSLCVDRHKDK
jgi:hypothetical protein